MNVFSRRKFLGTAALAAIAPFQLRAAEAAKAAGFHVGCQLYTFKSFTVMEALEMTSKAGGTVCEFFPGQKLDKDGDAKWDHNSTEDQIKKVEDQCAKFKITPMNYGVVGIPADEKEARKVFEFAKKLKLRAVTTESDGSIDTIDKLVKEYDVMVGFHDHPRKPLDPKYRMWDPNYIMELIKGRDPRVGACADTGHWKRSKLVPTECLEILKGHVISSHMKDLKGEKYEDQPFGEGESDIEGQLVKLKEMNFTGNISIEYERNWENSLGDVTKCIAYVREVEKKKGWV